MEEMEEMESHKGFNSLVHTTTFQMCVKICKEICDFSVISSPHYKYNVKGCCSIKGEGTSLRYFMVPLHGTTEPPCSLSGSFQVCIL